MFDSLKLAETSEKASQIFERYIADLIRRFPTLNAPTRLDFGPARIIVLDLQYVAPTGSAAANRQTEMMYLLARHILARNFFLHPEYLAFVPDRVKGYHRKRFTEVYETVKRVDYDEWHRTQGSPLVRAQAELDVREGRKHNVQLGFASQRLSDMGDGIIAQSTGRFVLGADDQRERDEIIDRFGLTEASAKIVRHRLTGPRRDGAPFLAIFRAEQAHYEQFLVNSPRSRRALGVVHHTGGHEPQKSPLREGRFRRGSAPAVQGFSERLCNGRDRAAHQGAAQDGRRGRSGRGGPG
jgi:intracellular multiplication protein IcmB